MKTYKTLLAEAQPWAKEVFEKIDKKLSQMTRKRASAGGPTASGAEQTI